MRSLQFYLIALIIFKLTPLLLLALAAGCTMKESKQPEAREPTLQDSCNPRELPGKNGVVLEINPTNPTEPPAALPESLFAPSSGRLIYDPGSDLPRGHTLNTYDYGGLL